MPRASAPTDDRQGRVTPVLRLPRAAPPLRRTDASRRPARLLRRDFGCAHCDWRLDGRARRRWCSSFAQRRSDAGAHRHRVDRAPNSTDAPGEAETVVSAQYQRSDSGLPGHDHPEDTLLQADDPLVVNRLATSTATPTAPSSVRPPATTTRLLIRRTAAHPISPTASRLTARLVRTRLTWIDDLIIAGATTMLSLSKFSVSIRFCNCRVWYASTAQTVLMIHRWSRKWIFSREAASGPSWTSNIPVQNLLQVSSRMRRYHAGEPRYRPDTVGQTRAGRGGLGGGTRL
jgi:hypothetical protein